MKLYQENWFIPGLMSALSFFQCFDTTTTTTFNALSHNNLGKPAPERILLEQEMIRWQWHQLNHMQIICTSLQTDNHASTSPRNFYRLDALPAAQRTVSKH